MLHVSVTTAKFRLGSTCEFFITKEDPKVEYRVYLKHQDILYLRPLSEWISSDLVELFPEAPGDYTLVLRWRLLQERKLPRNGQIEYPFRVEANVELSDSPELVTVDYETRFWTPNPWEAKLLSNYERPAIVQVLSLIEPGWIIYDIGANLGYYTVYFSRAVGPSGYVYSFETNPLCVYFLQTNLALNHIENCAILPAAIVDKDEAVPFTINYYSSAVGITDRSSFFLSKAGHQVDVKGYGLDQLVRMIDIKPPHLVKIDIEGAEEYAIRGMESVLRSHRPIILLEVHGKDAAEGSLPLLGSMGYLIQSLDSNRAETVEEFLNSFRDSVVQVLCVPKDKVSKTMNTRNRPVGRFLRRLRRLLRVS